MSDFSHDELSMLWDASLEISKREWIDRVLKLQAARATADHSDEWTSIKNATEWLITQPNGRSYTVTDKRKVGIALSCGYDVAAIESQSGKGESNG